VARRKAESQIAGAAGLGARAGRRQNEHALLLRRSGLRKTAARIAVLQFLERAAGPLSHGEIAGAIAALGFDRATVYRNLVDLAEAGLVARSDLGDHVWRFEIRRGGVAHVREHPHFLCVTCGGVTCLPGGAVRFVSIRGVPRAVASQDVEVQVKGRCDTCMA
jgi:Fur family transcriptional regulator, ferric uptake regulator